MTIVVHVQPHARKSLKFRRGGWTPMANEVDIFKITRARARLGTLSFASHPEEVQGKVAPESQARLPVRAPRPRPGAGDNQSATSETNAARPLLIDAANRPTLSTAASLAVQGNEGDRLCTNESHVDAPITSRSKSGQRALPCAKLAAAKKRLEQVQHANCEDIERGPLGCSCAR